jgi:ferredoxin
MLEFKNVKKVFTNPVSGNMEIFYSGNTITITLPDGKKITEEYKDDAVKIVTFQDGKQMLVEKTPHTFFVKDIVTGKILSCPLGTPCVPTQSENNYMKICPWCTNCGACIDSCPSRLIDYNSDGVVVFLGDCSGCGECLVICPVGAIRWK